MKKWFIILFAALLTVGASACAAQQAAEAASTSASQPDSSATSSASSALNVSPEQDLSADAQETELPSDQLFVADAAYYRGSILKIETDGDNKRLTLEQAVGTDFGAPKLQFRVNADTTLTFEDDRLMEGAYLEVYYGIGMEEQLDATQVYDTIGANIYPESAMVNFNGILKEYNPSQDKTDEGQLVMEDLANGQEVIFHYAPETGFYLDTALLIPGAKLNIFHRGVYTMSLPPQGSALELREYTEPIQ